MAIVQALVFWLEDKKTSIVHVENVPLEDRDPGKVSKVRWHDGSQYPAQIVKISKCEKTLRQAETKFLEKFNSLNPDVSKEPSRRSSKKTEDTAVTAVAIQVARALGEKVQLTPAQAAVKVAAAREKRFINASVKLTESSGDSTALQSRNVSNLKRPFDFDDDDDEDEDDDAKSTGASMVGAEAAAAADGNPHQHFQTPRRIVRPQKECEKCSDLLSKINPSSMEFLKALAVFCELEPRTGRSLSPIPLDTSIARQLRPVDIEAGHKKAELTAGSGLYLKKSCKSAAVVSAAGDPEKLTRSVLHDLYGDQLKQQGISALGHGKGKLGIGETDLKNIYAFVCRNSVVTSRKGKNNKILPDFSFHEFVKIVNKKLKSESRIRSHDKSSKSSVNLDKSIDSTIIPDSNPVKESSQPSQTFTSESKAMRWKPSCSTPLSASEWYTPSSQQSSEYQGSQNYYNSAQHNFEHSVGQPQEYSPFGSVLQSHHQPTSSPSQFSVNGYSTPQHNSQQDNCHPYSPVPFDVKTLLSL